MALGWDNAPKNAMTLLRKALESLWGITFAGPTLGQQMHQPQRKGPQGMLGSWADYVLVNLPSEEIKANVLGNIMGLPYHLGGGPSVVVRGDANNEMSLPIHDGQLAIDRAHYASNRRQGQRGTPRPPLGGSQAPC
jgi:hypothetical protein